MSFLEIKDLDVAYGDIRVVHGVRISVQSGKIFSIIGSNGAGKTTILNTVSGLLRPISGEIIFEGKRIDQTPTHHIVELGIIQVPEGRGLFQKLTVLENLRLGALNLEARKHFSNACDYVFGLFPVLSERKTQLAGTLSGGEQQMLAIARGLMAKPRVLMMDEPSLGLAPLAVKSVFETVETINAEGMTILLVEQNVYHSLRLCYYGYVLENGRIVLEGQGNDILGNEHVKKAYLGG